MADETLSDLGSVPEDMDALIERYLGSRRISAAQADAMLSELAARTSSPGPLPAARASAVPPRRRYNTPFPGGIAGADELPELKSTRSLRTPLPGFHPAVTPAALPVLPELAPLEPAARSVTPVPASAPPQPLAAEADERQEDSFEIIVDDEVLELESDDLLIEADEDE